MLDFYANIIYNISIKIKKIEGIKLLHSNGLQNILQQNGGIISTAEANSVGISNERLRLLVKSGDLERVSHGVYISPDEFLDKMFVTQKRKSKIIYSHETALFLHGLTDRDPVNYTVTVPTGYNAKSLADDEFTIFSIKRELHEIGIISIKTMFGNNVITYNLERTICDCIRSRNYMDIAVVTEAVKQYVKRRDKNLNLLMSMAKSFRVTKILRGYMEVLL